MKIGLTEPVKSTFFSKLDSSNCKKLLFVTSESRQVEIVSPPPPVVSDDRSPCPKCGDYFQNRGGAFFKHLNLCSVVPSQGSAASSLSDISCKKCGKIYPLNKRKNLIKHEEFCAGPDQTDLSSKENNEVLKSVFMENYVLISYKNI